MPCLTVRKENDAATARILWLKDNPAALLALSWYFSGNGRGEKRHALPYKDSLLLFSRYFAIASDGPGKDLYLQYCSSRHCRLWQQPPQQINTPAYVQQLREGVPLNFFMTFIGSFTR